MNFIKLLILVLITQFIAPSAQSIVSDGEKATAAVFNSSFMSKEADSATIGIFSLNNPNAASGPFIPNLQAAINSATVITYGNESITSGGTVSIDDKNIFERRTISGTPGVVTAAGVLFGAGPFADAKTVRLLGDSDTSTVKVITSDVVDGVLLKGNGYTMTLGDYLDLEYDLTRRRWVEVNRSRETNASVYTIKADENIRIEPQTKVTITEDVEILDNNVLELKDLTGGEGVSLKSPNPLSSSYVLTLPPNSGNSNQLMFSNGAGVLDWKDIFIASNDNRLMRSDTVADAELQESGITVDDSDNMTGIADITTTNLNAVAIGKYLYDDSTHTVTNKKLDGGTASTSNQWLPPEDTRANLDILCATLTAGSLVYATDQNKYFLCDGVVLSELGGGAGQGGINYITNFGAEDDVSGFQTYLDAVAGTPIDGIGGSPNGTLIRNVTTPLRSLADFQFTKAVSSLGEGFSTDFTIDNADKAQVLSVSFDYDLSAANYTETGLRVYIYNKDSGAINEIVPRDIAGGKGTYSGYYQTTIDDDDYRLVIHVSDALATSYTGYFDNFRVGPQAVAIKNSSVVLSVYGSATENRVDTLPANVQFDSILQDTLGGYSTANKWYVIQEPGYYFITGYLGIQNLEAGARRTYTRIEADIGGGFTSIAFIPRTSNSTASTSDPHHFSKTYYFNIGDKVAINFQSLDDSSFDINHGVNTSTLEIFKIGSDSESSSGKITYGYIGQSLPTSGISGTQIAVKFPALTKDSHGNYNPGTGGYTVTESGTYDVSAQVEYLATYVNGNDVNMSIRKNGSVIHWSGVRVSASKSRELLPITGLVDVVKGDVISIWAASGGTSPAWAASLGGSGFNIHKVESGGGNASIASAVRIKYMSNDGQIMTNGVFTDVTYEVKIYDSHNAFNTTTGVFTAPRKVNCVAHAQVAFSGASSWNVGELVSGNLSCTNCGRVNLRPQEDDTYNIGTAAVNDHFELLKGQTVKFSVFQNSGLDVTLNNAKADNYFTLECK